MTKENFISKLVVNFKGKTFSDNADVIIFLLSMCDQAYDEGYRKAMNKKKLTK